MDILQEQFQQWCDVVDKQTKCYFCRKNFSDIIYSCGSGHNICFDCKVELCIACKSPSPLIENHLAKELNRYIQGLKENASKIAVSSLLDSNLSAENRTDSVEKLIDFSSGESVDDQEENGEDDEVDVAEEADEQDGDEEADEDDEGVEQEVQNKQEGDVEQEPKKDEADEKNKAENENKEKGNVEPDIFDLLPSVKSDLDEAPVYPPEGNYPCNNKYCNFFGPFLNIITHYETVHPSQYEEIMTYSFPYSRSWDLTYSGDTTEILRALNIKNLGLFLLHVIITNGGEVKGSLLLYNSRKEALKYLYTMEIECDEFKKTSQTLAVHTVLQTERDLYNNRNGLFVGKNIPELYAALQSKLKFKCSVELYEANNSTINFAAIDQQKRQANKWRNNKFPKKNDNAPNSNKQNNNNQTQQSQDNPTNSAEASTTNNPPRQPDINIFMNTTSMPYHQPMMMPPYMPYGPMPPQMPPPMPSQMPPLMAPPMPQSYPPRPMYGNQPRPPPPVVYNHPNQPRPNMSAPKRHSGKNENKPNVQNVRKPKKTSSNNQNPNSNPNAGRKEKKGNNQNDNKNNQSSGNPTKKATENKPKNNSSNNDGNKQQQQKNKPTNSGNINKNNNNNHQHHHDDKKQHSSNHNQQHRVRSHSRPRNHYKRAQEESDKCIIS